MLTAQDIEEKLRLLKPVIAERFHVRTIGLFGSYATGQATEHSDVDILVEFERPIGWAFFDLQDLLAQELDRQVDLVMLSGLKERIKPMVISQTRFV